MTGDHVGLFDGIARVLGGKGQLRLIIQPAVAIVLGIRLGISDARAGEEPFVFRLFRHPEHLVRRALSDVAVPFAVAIGVDLILQYYTLGYVRLVGAVLVGLLLVWLPFSIARGLANRIARREHAAGGHRASSS